MQPTYAGADRQIQYTLRLVTRLVTYIVDTPMYCGNCEYYTVIFTSVKNQHIKIFVFSCFSTIEDTPFEDEDGDLRDKEDVAFRQEAINEKNHVTWNAQRRCFISAMAAER